MLAEPTPLFSSRSSSPVKKRCVFYIVGYEPLPPTRLYRRFERGLNYFRQTWNATAQLSPPTTAPDGVVSWQVETAGPNWRVDSEIVSLDWTDFVADFAHVSWRQIVQGFAALFDFLLSGASIKYLRTNWRYMMFCAFPILLVALFAIAGFIVARFALPSTLPWRSVLGPLLGVASVVLLVRWAGRRLFLNYALLDWSFAADIVHRRRPDFETKLDHLARAFADRVRTSTADEIIVFGHSLGAVVMIQVVARALQQDPWLAGRAGKINLVSAGSSLLKIGLHPSAAHFRLAVSKVIAEPAIFWVEYQALVDIFNFYKTDPVAEMGLSGHGKPTVQIIRLRNMMSEEAYRRIRYSPLRLHRQFTLGNERRYAYDFFMICCGPLPLQRRVSRHLDDAVTAFAPDGTFLDAPPIEAEALTGLAAVENHRP